MLGGRDMARDVASITAGRCDGPPPSTPAAAHPLTSLPLSMERSMQQPHQMNAHSLRAAMMAMIVLLLAMASAPTAVHGLLPPRPLWPLPCAR